MNPLEVFSLLSSYKVEFITSVVSGATCGVIGCFVILRRMALIGDALSHSILPGVVLAFLLSGTSPLAMFIGAMIAGIFTTFAIAFLQNHARIKEDAAVGLVFAVLFALGIILFSQLPRGTHFDLKCFLFGNPLAIRPGDAKVMISIGILVCFSVFLFYRPLQISTFDPIMATTMGISVTFIHYLMMTLLSATVVASLVTVGVIMVVAMIIAPGVTAYQLTDRLPVMLVLAGFLGALSAALGFFLSFWQNWPVGPAMTVTAGFFFLMAMAFSPQYGILWNYMRQRSLRRHFKEEDILKQLVRKETETLQLEEISRETRISRAELQWLIQSLSKGGYLNLKGEEVTLMEPGRERAHEILRTHRLFETYMATQGIHSDHVHHVAEALEHAHEMAEELNQVLGRPEKDPHGQTIPQKTEREVE